MAEGSCEYECRSDAEWLDRDSDGPSREDVSSFGSASRAALEATIGRAFHMRVLKEIAHLSQNYPTLPLVLTESKISIPSTVPDGFAMSIETNRGISERTVRFHLNAAREKLQCTTTTQAVAKAVSQQLFVP